MLPKLVITDIDGVWTDGGMYYDQQGNEWKKFNTADSAAVLFLKKLQIPVAIFTGEDTAIVSRRAQKLGIHLLFQGVTDKYSQAAELCTEFQISIKDIAFIGDDLNDMRLLKHCGWSGCPSNAPVYIQKLVNFVCKKHGGSGAFREFVEDMLIREGKMEEVLLPWR